MTKQLKVDNIVNVAGTGKPNFPVSPTSGGAALSTLNTHSYTSSATEPSSPKNGAIWWDSANSKVYVYANGEFKEVTLNTDYPSAYTFFSWGGDRGVFAGGDEGSSVNRIQYIDISTPGNSTDFGNLLENRRYASGTSNASRGLNIGGYTNSSVGTVDIQYVTISTPGNSQDFGDLQAAHYYYGSSCSDGTKAFTFGGYSSNGVLNNIQQTVIATTGNSTDFGDVSVFSYYNASCSDATRAVCALGRTRTSATSGSLTYKNTMEYITTASAGNTTDFGDLTVTRGQFTGTSDTTRGLFLGGIKSNNVRTNTIDYITIQTTGNATDFGDLSQNNSRSAACSNSTRGIIGGGYTTTGGNTRVNTIEYVTIQTTGNVTDFGDLAAVNYGLSAFAGNPS